MAAAIAFRPSSYYGDGLPRQARHYAVHMAAEVLNGPTLDYQRAGRPARFIVDLIVAAYDLISPVTGGPVWVCTSISLHGFHIRADGSYGPHGDTIRGARGYQWYARDAHFTQRSLDQAPIEFVEWAMAHNPGRYAARTTIGA
jgi:hypothetical protein